MKTPENMTRDELVKYANDLKCMIRNLQSQLSKALEAMVEERKKSNREVA